MKDGTVKREHSWPLPPELREEASVATRLLGKEYSPMIIRKSNTFGFPLYVGIICDLNLDDFDEAIFHAIGPVSLSESPSIQELRNVTGIISEYVKNWYNAKKEGSVEGVAVILYADKIFISSLWGDFMNHNMCRMELYQALNFMTQV